MILPEWAAEIGALIISIEHRFFGLSNPSNASDPIERYKSLTLENVMSDAVNFINTTKHTVAGAKDSKVVVMGGSYAGSLTVFLKLNHPEVFYGAIAWAAQLQSIGSNYQNPQRYDWFKYVSNTDLKIRAEQTTNTLKGKPDIPRLICNSRQRD